MTPERLRDLIASGETLEVEFKGEERKSLSDDELIEAVVCLANRSSNAPAWLLIGWRDRRLTTEEAACLTLKTESEVRATLNRLVEIGLVEPRGERKGRTWHLSDATHRRLWQRAAYVRQRGFEPLQQEQMVLQYVGKHGRITRKEAAELCRISGPQAYRLLDRLAEQGQLAREGERGRGVSYRKSTK